MNADTLLNERTEERNIAHKFRFGRLLPSVAIRLLSFVSLPFFFKNSSLNSDYSQRQACLKTDVHSIPIQHSCLYCSFNARDTCLFRQSHTAGHLLLCGWFFHWIQLKLRKSLLTILLAIPWNIFGGTRRYLGFDFLNYSPNAYEHVTFSLQRLTHNSTKKNAEKKYLLQDFNLVIIDSCHGGICSYWRLTSQAQQEENHHITAMTTRHHSQLLFTWWSTAEIIRTPPDFFFPTSS